MIESTKIEKKYGINPETNRRVLSDYKVTVFPTKSFQDDQYRANVHHKNLKEYRITQEGAVVIKPIRDQYPTRHDFEQFQADQNVFTKAKPGA